ncbi:precorrin-3b c17-methyltransferase [Leptolyngbya sp. Heron Island J]|uniref:precorrin-3B C(17)-methyltransferase n=1 Tax=Leptolyngbya sp. Heron Island J TaxID=1385935 RepID=UPI0003B97603|nr:precorrin-3B C(17)-methyltransferase [Leptolyngbya sp. Heron Island J]ESA38677.1 precorrin-3b c17-methyltransferase [Leptolyngbya sp. Heron Island J]
MTIAFKAASQQKSRIVLIAPTLAGCHQGVQLWDGLHPLELWTRADTLTTVEAAVETATDLVIQGYSGSLAPVVANCWGRATQLVFFLPVGAVVRLIAPLLQHKAQDPGVVAIDDTGQFVVSVSGGHQGGADALTRQCAALLGAEPVITSASAGQQLPALDLLGLPYGWQRGAGDWTEVAAALTQQRPIVVYQTCGGHLWRQLLSADAPFHFLDQETASTEAGLELSPKLWISDQLPPEQSSEKSLQVCWHPRTLWLGLGCERGTSAELIETSMEQVLRDRNLAWSSIAGIASIDLKQDEVAFQTLAEQYQWPLRCFSAAQLAALAVPNPSDVVAQAVGTPSVAEAAALLSAQSQELLVTKQVFKSDQGACTVAVARATQAYNARPGHLYLIGSGPGSLAQLTAAARTALLDCDVVIGYGLYLELLRPLFHPNQVIETSKITQEVQRAERAVTLAQQGLTVGMVSSGDCGIYGMGGLVLECLAQGGWDGQTPGVSVLPGITALQAVAARVGAPLMHDFCAISLSDLLTPWQVIENRLEAAAQGDFVVALYNPRSQTRTQGIKIALEILGRHRSPDTPVAIARSLYRSGESVHCLTLATVDVTTIDMLTVVLIGNSRTFLHQDHMITPRGYQVSTTSKVKPG